MSRPYRKYAIPSRDAVVTTGEMIVFLPEEDRTGNAVAYPPLVEYVWGRPAAAAAPPGPSADASGTAGGTD